MSMQRTLYLSLKKLKCHEFHTTLRRMGYQPQDWAGRYELLNAIESDAIKNLVRYLSALAISYSILTSLRDDNSLSLKVVSYEVAVPAAYFLTAISFLFFLSALAFCHTSVAMSLKSRESGKLLLSGFSASIYSLIKKPENDLSLGIPLFSNYFIKEVIPVSSIIAGSILVGIFSLLLPFLAFLAFVCREEAILLLSPDASLLERIAVGAGIVLSILSILCVFLFHLPLPTHKNVQQIRWNFLSYLYPASTHPESRRWLKRDLRDE